MHWYSGGNLEPAIRFTLKITAIRLISELINIYGFSGRTANILGKNEFLYLNFRFPALYSEEGY